MPDLVPTPANPKAYLIRDLKRGYWTKRGYAKSPGRARRYTKDEAQKWIGLVDDDVVVEETD